MSEFWTSELGEITGKAEDAFTGDMFKSIPDGTLALSKIDSFVNQEHKETGFKYLEITWLLMDGDFKGRKVQHKLKVFGGNQYDKDPIKVRHKALNMLKLLYQLFNIKPTHANPPEDRDLMPFVGKVAGIKIRETEPNQYDKTYNWISEVHSSQGFKSQTGAGIVVTHVNSKPSNHEQGTFDSAFNRNKAPIPDDQMDDDIPF